MKKILVVAAHPDDETLGAGGTILKHKANGDNVSWLIVTNINEKDGYKKSHVELREKEIDLVAEKYNFDNVFKLEIPTSTLSTSSLFNLIPKISNIFKDLEPEVIYTMNRSDAHSDHRIIFDAVMSCTKSFRHPYVKSVLMYECLLLYEFDNLGACPLPAQQAFKKDDKCRADPTIDEMKNRMRETCLE